MAAWLLACTAYLAVAAVAFVLGQWWYADILWGVGFFVIVYAAAVAPFERGRRQAAGAGFAVASLLLVLCLHFEPASLPTGRILVAFAVGQPPPAPREAATLYAPAAGSAADGGSIGASLQLTLGARRLRYPEQEQWLVRYRAANAVCVVVAGVVGGALGVLAQRRAPDRAREAHCQR